MYKMIRCSSDFGLVILVTPANAKIDNPEARYFRYATWQIGNHEPGVFNEIDKHLAISYFSGIADGLGFGDLPTETFPDLGAAIRFVRQKRREHEKKIMLEIYNRDAGQSGLDDDQLVKVCDMIFASSRQWRITFRSDPTMWGPIGLQEMIRDGQVEVERQVGIELAGVVSAGDWGANQDRTVIVTLTDLFDPRFFSQRLRVCIENIELLD